MQIHEIIITSRNAAFVVAGGDLNGKKRNVSYLITEYHELMIISETSYSECLRNSPFFSGTRVTRMTSGLSLEPLPLALVLLIASTIAVESG